MIVEYLRYSIDAARQEDFVAAYQAASVALLASPFCQGYEMCRCIEDPSQFIVRIEWTSAEDHLKGFRTSAHFREFFAEVKPFLNDIDEMRHYERL